MGATKSGWRGSQLFFRDGTTYETVLPLAPQVVFDDFRGAVYDSNQWLYNDAGAATEALSADVAGVHDVVLTFDATNENQEAGIGWQGNQLPFNPTKGLVLEARMALVTLPTLVTEAHLGFLGEAFVDDKQIVSAEDYKIYCVFSAVGSGIITINCDDNVAGPQHAVATGITVLAGAYHIYRIDMTDITNILFYIDGAGVATGTTFTLDSLVADTLQPVAFMTKHDGAGLGVMNVDFIKIWQNR